MAVTDDYAIRTPLHGTEYENLSVDATASTLVVSSTVVYRVEIDNSNNSAISYLKMYDVDGPAAATDDPLFVIPVPANTVLPFRLADSAGYTFGTAVALRCTTGKDNDNTDSPASAVLVSVWTD